MYLFYLFFEKFRFRCSDVKKKLKLLIINKVVGS